VVVCTQDAVVILAVVCTQGDVVVSWRVMLFVPGPGCSSDFLTVACTQADVQVPGGCW
jgi:hypothetical protein